MINEARLLQNFLEYIQIDSETGNEKNMGERLIKDLEALGCKVWKDDAGEKFGSNGFNVYASLPGGDATAEPLLFSAHMDTVKPGNGVKPVVENGVIRSSGDTILGGDDKSGIAGIIEALHVIKEQNLNHRPVEIMFSIAEEGGMEGVKRADLSNFKAKEALVFDTGGDVGGITTAAPGQVKFNAVVTGKSAHAGVAPETGISAIQAAAAGIAAMQLLRIDPETTANIGTFKSEYATNIVPEKATIFGEVRSRSVEKLNAQAAAMKKCMEEACAKYGATLELNMDTAYLAYTIADDEPLVQKVFAACEKIGVQAHTQASGGGSDSNIMNHSGIKAVVLATGMDKVHTTAEQIAIKNLNKTAGLCVALMTV